MNLGRFKTGRNRNRSGPVRPVTAVTGPVPAGLVNPGREQERRNSDMYSARVHGPPRRGGRQDARACRVGGGQGDGGGCAPAGGRFAGRAPGRFQYSYGPRDRGFGGGYDAPRFPRGGGR